MRTLTEITEAIDKEADTGVRANLTYEEAMLLDKALDYMQVLMPPVDLDEVERVIRIII